MNNRNMFDPNYLYKHINNTEVAFQVSSIGFNAYSQLISVRWFNIVNPDNIYFIDIQHNITVPDQDSHKWVKFAVITDNGDWKVVSHEASLY